MKIGIITFHCSYNYGSALQAYSLQKHLADCGHSVKIIDYVNLQNFADYRLFRTELYRHKLKSLIGDIYYLPQNSKRKKAFEGFKNEYFNLTDKTYTAAEDMRELNGEFDAFICGSDQIWNINCTKGADPAFFLAFADEEKPKIAYAPSIADGSIDFTKHPDIIDYLKRFNSISIREKSLVPMVEAAAGMKVEAAVDPTLLLSAEDFEKLAKASDTGGKYIFAFALGDGTAVYDEAKRLAAEKGLKTVYINKQKIGGLDLNKYGATPREFLGLIKNAEYVITNSFHATVFSVLFEKKFCTARMINSSARMEDFLTAIGLEGRLLDNETDIDAPADFKAAKAKLNELSEKSNDFLKNSLN